MTRAELARLSGCNLETIRYYEKIGLIPPPPRNAVGYRLYDAHHVKRLRFILRSRELGFSIEEIHSLLELIDQGIQTCAEVQEHTFTHLQSIRGKIKDLQHIETILSNTAARCSGAAVPDCPILEALFS